MKFLEYNNYFQCTTTFNEKGGLERIYSAIIDAWQDRITTVHKPKWHCKMNVSPTEVRSVLKSLLYVYVQEREKKGYLNYTNPYLLEQEQIAASLYILIIVGFFGFLLFSLMMSNIVSRQRENYMDYLYQKNFPRIRIPPHNGSLLAAEKISLSKPSSTSQCQKTNSCKTEANLESVLRNV